MPMEEVNVKTRNQRHICALAGLCCSLLMVTAGGGQEQSETRSSNTLVELISDARLRSLDRKLDMAARSASLDEAIELRQQLIAEGTASDDPETGCWHTDQAEDLLLRRIEFPNSWSTHLFNADKSCPLLPPEIPLIIARGIEEVSKARSEVNAAIAMIEREADQEPERATLLDRLYFERDLRIPLLEAIGLILASNIEEAASDQALTILDDIDQEIIELNEAEAILSNWRIQAATAQRNKQRLAQELDGVDQLQSPFDRIRAIAVLEGPESAIQMAREAFDQGDSNRIYDRLLLADLHARYLDEIHRGRSQDEVLDWEDGAIELWLDLLEIDHETRDVIDAAIAARLLAIAERREQSKMPLAVAWAMGRAELARRSRGEIGKTDTKSMLANCLRSTDGEGLVEARALEVLFRLTLLEGERLEAARIGRRIYQEHPTYPGPGPAMIVNLVEPWAINGNSEAAEIYEEALLRQVAEKNSKETGAGTVSSQIARIRLARHYRRIGRVKQSRSILEGLEPTDEAIAIELIEVRAKNLEDAAKSGLIDRPEIFELQAQLADDGRRYLRTLSNNGEMTVTPRLLQEIYRARLSAVGSNLQYGPRKEDLQVANSIIERTDLASALRIEALFLRQKIRFMDPETRAEVIEDATDIARALGLNLDLSMRRVIGELNSSFTLVDEARDAGRIGEAEKIARDRLHAITKLISTEYVLSMTLQERMLVARAMSLGGWQEKSIAIWDSILEEQPDAWEVLEGRADALARSEKERDLGEAIQLYLRLGQGDPGQFTPETTWWNAQLGQLLVLEEVGRSLERIGPRIERLRLRDKDLGGPRFKRSFESLQERVRARPNG